MGEQLVTVGDRIRRAVENSGQPYTEVIKKIPVSKGAYSQWINNVTSPTVANLLKLADITNCDPAWILFGTERSNPEAKEVVREVIKEVVKEVRVPADIGNDMVRVPELIYSNDPDVFGYNVKPLNNWVLPRNLVEMHFRCEPEWAALVEVAEFGIGGLSEYDYVLIDRTPAAPHRTGLYVLGIELSLIVRHLTRIPSSEGLVRVRGVEEDYNISVSDIDVIGRVTGVIKKQMAGPYQPPRIYEA